MERRLKIALLPAILLMLSVTDSFAQQTPERVAGGLFSVGNCGLTLSRPVKGGLYSEARLLVDLEGILSGHSADPGVKGEYCLNFQLKKWDFRNGMVLRWYAGPGVTGGFVHDNTKDYGLMFGLCGDTLLRATFPESPIELRLGLTADVAWHTVVHNKYNMTLTLYQNGLIDSLYPELGIGWRF